MHCHLSPQPSGHAQAFLPLALRSQQISSVFGGVLSETWACVGRGAQLAGGCRPLRMRGGRMMAEAAFALAASVYALAVSSIAIMLGQRLAIQATAQLTASHEANMAELSGKFISVLIALLISLGGVVGGA